MAGGSIRDREIYFSFLPQQPDRLWGPWSIPSGWYGGDFPGEKWMEREAKHPSPSISPVTNAWNYTVPDLFLESGWIKKRNKCILALSHSEVACWLVEALCYKTVGRWFDSRRVHWIFNWPNPSSRTMALGLTKPVTEMSTRNIPGNKERPALKADNLTAICEPIV
jgi:hypothetical protein